MRRPRGPAAYIVLAVLAAVLAGAALALRSPAPSASDRAARSAPTATPPTSAPDPLGSAVSEPGTLLAAVYDVATGREWSIGTGRPQAEASIVKLDILQALLARDRLLPASYLPVARQMMEDSNNDAASSLWYASGGPGGIGAYNAAAGLRGTKLSACVACAGFRWPGWGLTTTTPEDQIALLRQLVSPRSLLSASQRRYVLGLMENVAPGQRWGVSGGVPPGVTVALKDGWLPLDAADHDWQVNSIGWIDGDGRDYLLAVLTTGNATERVGITRIDQLSSLVWTNMG